MSFNNISHTLVWTLGHSQKASSDEMQAKKTQMQSPGFGKGLPLDLKSEMCKAKHEISKAIKSLPKTNPAMSLENCKNIGIMANKFNRIETKDGQTKLLPIGLMALSRLKPHLPKVAIEAMKSAAMKDAMAKMQQEYIRHQVINSAPVQKAAQSPVDLPAIKTPAIDPAPKISTLPDEENAPLPGTTEKTETSRPAPAKAAGEDSPVVATAENHAVSSETKLLVEEQAKVVEEIKVEEVKVEEPKAEDNTKVKRSNSEKRESSLSFWQKILNFFKWIWEATVSFFTGKKKEENQ
jgi:hypothetical protein